MKRNDFLKILKERGVVFYMHGSNHDIYIHKDTGKKNSHPKTYRDQEFHRCGYLERNS
jgi:hypothetical protein